MGAVEPPSGWYRIAEPLDGVTTRAQEATIREYAREHGFPTLRGYASHLRMLGWDYYDVLKVASP